MGYLSQFWMERFQPPSAFFNLPSMEKVKFMSNDVRQPVRYGTSIKDGADKVQFWRTFLKHYANPPDDWLSIWPDAPLDSRDGKWTAVRRIQGALQVNVGDHLGVLSNGLYKSVVHRVTLSSDTIRISIASLHTLGMDEKVETAKELVDEQHPKGYRDSSFKHFLDFCAQNDIADGKSFIDALRITNQ